MTPTAVRIEGSGLAACCCARLLHDAGIPVVAQRPSRPGVPVILIPEATSSLLAAVFRCENPLAGQPLIRRRIVAWGPESAPLELPHHAYAVPESWLLDRLWETTPTAESSPDAPSWTIHASKPPPASAPLSFGERIAHASAVTLSANAPSDACWIESASEGWLFLATSGPRRAWLLSMGAEASSLLSSSRLVASQIESLEPASASFPAHPRILRELIGPGWLACGSAAMSLDPISGQGAAAAVRESILAAALIRASYREPAPEGLAEHYANRLLAGFLRHLALTRPFYATGGYGPWWQTALAQLDDAIAWTKSQPALRATPRFLLRDFDLVELGGV